MDSQEPEVVGIVGAGRLGKAMARTALRAGRRVVIANSRGPDSLTDVVSELGDRAVAGRLDAQILDWPTVVLGCPTLRGASLRA